MSRRVRTKTLAVCAALCVTVALGPAARADHNGTPIPSRQQVDAAGQHVITAQRSVSAIESDLAAAGQRLEDLGVAAEQASEAYNGARLAWQNAKADAIAARLRAERAIRNAAVAREQLAGYLVAADSSGSDLTSFSMALTVNGPHTLLRDISQADTSTRTLDSHMQRWRATARLVKVYRADADSALVDAHHAKHLADKARSAAENAVALQQAAVASIDTQRQSLLAELAAAQHISVSLAAQRQQGLEQRREERRREARRLVLLAQQRRAERQQQREARLHREAVQQRRAAHRQAAQGGGTPQPSSTDTAPPTAPKPAPSAPPTNPVPTNPAPTNPAPSPPPTPTPPPTSTGDPQAAIDFAYAQLGEPYVWGAAGPDSWDCSGLTMGAWANAGVSLPHYSVSQYYATTPVSYADLQPGDLIFWASDPSNPDTVFHVALYIGNGKMIQAPRTGRNVEIQDVWYWEAPDFFTRP